MSRLDRDKELDTEQVKLRGRPAEKLRVRADGRVYWTIGTAVQRPARAEIIREAEKRGTTIGQVVREIIEQWCADRMMKSLEEPKE